MDLKERAELVRVLRVEMKQRSHGSAMRAFSAPAQIRASYENRAAENAMFSEERSARRSARRLSWRRRVGSPWQDRAAAQNAHIEERMFFGESNRNRMSKR